MTTNAAFAASLASDAASNAGYTTGNSFNGINGGTGWGSTWAITGPSGAAGTIFGTSYANSDSAGYPYKLPAPVFDLTSPNGSTTTGTTATRSFTGTLTPGQTFAFQDVLVNGLAGAPIGMKLLDSTGTQLFDEHVTGGGGYTYSDQNVTNAALGTVPYNYVRTDMVRFTLLDSAGDYSLTTVYQDNSNNTLTYTTTGTIQNNSGAAKFAFYNFNNGGSFTDFQVNNLSVVQPIFTGGSGSNWATAGSWTQASSFEAGLPASGNAIQIAGASGGSTNNNLPANTLLNGITYTAAAGGYTVTGNAINLGFNVVNNSPNAQTINTPIVLTQPVTVNAAAANVSLGGAISGTGSLTATGGHTINLTGANSYTGGTTIGTGTVSFTSGALGTSGNIKFSGGSLQYGTGNTQDISSRIAGSASTINIDTNGKNVNYSSALASTNTGGLTKAGAGTLTISAPGAYTGATNITGGTLQLGAGPTSLQSVGGVSPALHIDASSLTAGAVTTLTNTGSGGGTFSGTGTVVTNAMNGKSAISFNGSNNAFTSTTAYSVNGSAVTIFIAENQLGRSQQYSGEMSFIGTTNGTDYNTAGNFAVDGQQTSDTIKIESNNGNFASINRPAVNTPTVWDANLSGGTANTKLTTVANQASPLTATGSGITSFNANETAIGARFSGGVTGNFWQGNIGEILVFNSSLTPAQQSQVEQYLNYKWLGIGTSTGIANGSLPTGTPVSISGGGTLDLNSFSQTIGSLSSTDSSTQVTLGSATLTTGSDNSNTAFAGTISGTGGLKKSGNGNFTVSNSNSYQGGTTLSSGTLTVSNTTGSATGSGTVIVSGGTLASGPVGTISGPVTADTSVAGGPHMFAPGGVGSVGTLNLGSTLGLNGNSTLNFDINGTSDDQLAIAGALSILSGTPHVTLNTAGSLSGSYTLATYANSAVTASSFSLPAAPTGYAWHVTNTSLFLSPTAMKIVSLTNAGVGAGRGAVSTSGGTGSYTSTVFDESGTTGDTNGYIDITGSLPTPATDHPVDVLVDLTGTSTDIAALLSGVTGTPSSGFQIYSATNDPNGVFAALSGAYSSYSGPGGPATWDAVFEFDSLPPGTSPGSLKFNWDFTGTNVALDKAAVVPEPKSIIIVGGLLAADC